MSTIYCGRIPDQSVATALDAIESRLPQQYTCILRSLDSVIDPDDISWSLTAHGIMHTVVAGNVCVPSTAFSGATRAGLLSGFDEVWIFAGPPPNYSLIDVPGATSATTSFGDHVPDALSAAFTTTDCVLLLADGDGLNFATTIPSLADRLREWTSSR